MSVFLAMDPQPSNQIPTEPTPEPTTVTPEQPAQPNGSSTFVNQMNSQPSPEVTTPATPASAQDLPISTSDNTDNASPEPTVNEVAFSWQASEYIQHHKGTAWYALLGLVVLVFVIIAAILKLWLAIALFSVMGAAIAVYAKKEPRILNYELDSSGVTIEGKHYPYNMFRSFAVFQDIEWHSIELDPTQRFMPRLTLLFSDENIDKIADHLMLHLPNSERQPDLIERITRRLRF